MEYIFYWFWIMNKMDSVLKGLMGDGAMPPPRIFGPEPNLRTLGNCCHGFFTDRLSLLYCRPTNWVRALKEQFICIHVVQ